MRLSAALLLSLPLSLALPSPRELAVDPVPGSGADARDDSVAVEAATASATAMRPLGRRSLLNPISALTTIKRLRRKYRQSKNHKTPPYYANNLLVRKGHFETQLLIDQELALLTPLEKAFVTIKTTYLRSLPPEERNRISQCIVDRVRSLSLRSPAVPYDSDPS